MPAAPYRRCAVWCRTMRRRPEERTRSGRIQVSPPSAHPAAQAACRQCTGLEKTATQHAPETSSGTDRSVEPVDVALRDPALGLLDAEVLQLVGQDAAEAWNLRPLHMALR